MSEIQESGTRRKIKLTYIVTAVALSCLMVGASLGIIISGTGTLSIPTVIEPGSMVSTIDFVIFTDGLTYYAKNGTTGAITYSSANPNTVLVASINALSNGGGIFIHSGNYNLGLTNFTIDYPGINIYGEKATILIGQIVVRAENIQFHDLAITGNLTFTSKTDFSHIAQYFSGYDISVTGGVRIISLAGATAVQSPFNIMFYGGVLIPQYNGQDCLNINASGPTGNINHIFFIGTNFGQAFSGNAVTIWGVTQNIRFTDCFFGLSVESTVGLNLTGGGNQYGISFQNCVFELEPSATKNIVVSIGLGMQSYYFDITISDSLVLTSGTTGLHYLVRDDTQTGAGYHRITFINDEFISQIVTVRSGSMVPGTLIRILECKFIMGNSGKIYQAYGGWVGELRGNTYLNPFGKIALPFVGSGTGTASISINCSSEWSHHADPSPTNAWDYTVHDTDVLVTSTGGTNVSITIKDSYGHVVLSGASTLTRQYIPMGYSINFGNFDYPSGIPTTTVEGT